MEKLSNRLASIISSELNYNQDKKEIIEYGAFALIQILITLILIAIFGIIFNVIWEALIVCFTGSLLRKYSGGAHASSPNTCTAISIIICIGQALIFKFLLVTICSITQILFLGILIFLWSCYLILKLAPVDSPAKPIKIQTKIIRMKKGSIVILSLYLIIVIINIFMFINYKNMRFLLYSLCIYGGIAWQTFSLTSPGHKTISKIDSFLNQIYKIIIRGGK